MKTFAKCQVCYQRFERSASTGARGGAAYCPDCRIVVARLDTASHWVTQLPDPLLAEREARLRRHAERVLRECPELRAAAVKGGAA